MSLTNNLHGKRVITILNKEIVVVTTTGHFLNGIEKSKCLKIWCSIFKYGQLNILKINSL